MYKMLIVEDNKTVAKMTGKMFQKMMNVEITFANTGEGALDLCRHIIFDIIIMDIGLGQGIDGVETTKYIRDIEKKLNREKCPIFALTGHDCQPSELDEHKRMGLDKTYSKPARKEIMEEMLVMVPKLKKA